MAYSFAHYCPNCRVPHEVFVDEAHRPEGLPAFQYQCPRCQDDVTYAPFLFLSKSTIPVNAVVATRHATEKSEGMAHGQLMAKAGANSTATPIRVEPIEREVRLGGKGPLSSLGAKKTFSSDSSSKEPNDAGPPDPFEEVASLRGHRGWVRLVLFSQDRTIVASGGSDGGIRLWRFAHNGAPEQTVPHLHPGGVQSLALTLDNSRLASAAGQPEGTVRLWDLTSTKPKLRALLQVPKTPVESLAFSPSGNLLCIGCDKAILLWNVAKPALR